MGASVLLQRTFTELLQSEPADVVVSVYPLFGRAVYGACRDACPDPDHPMPYVTVVTDLAMVHAMWFEPTVRMCLVPTDAVSEKAIQSGLKAEQVRVTGIPVDPRLAQPPADRKALRRALGWDAELPAVLVAGGGAGAGPMEEIARILSARLGQAQVAVLAGHNEELRSRLAGESWPGPVYVYGFTDRVPDMLHAADVLVTKAGGLSLSEGMACGLPLVIYEVYPGQEEGNLAYVQTREAGVYAPTPEEVANVLERWLDPDNDELAEYAANSRRAGQPMAADHVARYIWRLATGAR
jgi:1,2-diacylglycerol 3-beta-galactosyltransferase